MGSKNRELIEKPFFSVWEGVYDSFEEAGGTLEAFNTAKWIEQQRAEVLEFSQNLKKEGLGFVHTRDYPLPLVVALCLERCPKVSILDIGGGMGLQYLQLLSQIPMAVERIQYCVLEGKKTVASVPDEMKSFKNLSFIEDLNSSHKAFDIVRIGSTMPYIDDWKGLLSLLIERYSPLYFVFSDLMAGEIPTFVSTQKYYDKKIPHRFYSWGEFLEFMSQQNPYNLIYKSKFVHEILGQEEVFPNFALDEKYRIDRALNVVFSRIRG